MMVAAADQLAPTHSPWKVASAGEFRQLCADVRVLQEVDVGEGLAARTSGLGGLAEKPQLVVWGSLHVQDDGIFSQPLFDLFG